MKKCEKCGEPNFIRRALVRDWWCKSCGSLIEKKHKPNGEAVTSGNKLTGKKYVFYEGYED